MEKNRPDSTLSNSEIYRLRKNILETVRKEKAKKRRLKTFFAAAASFILLFGLGYNYQIQKEPSLEDYVRSAPKINMYETEGVTLLLGNDSKVNLNEANTLIQYSSSGESVNIGAGNKVTQKSRVEDKAVFNTIIVPYSKRTTLELSDGTMVWLNSGSKLIYPAVFSGNERPVYLEGEAIFDVAHNAEKPFKVSSQHQEIEVLGTVFNVTNYPGDDLMETVLKSGSVKITYQNGRGKRVKLSPGNLSSLNIKSSEVKTRKVNVADYFSWRSGYLNLEKNTLAEIMTKLSRYYNFDFTIQDEVLANQTFSGKLDLKEDFEKILKVLQATTEFDFQVIDKKIIIQ